MQRRLPPKQGRLHGSAGSTRPSDLVVFGRKLAQSSAGAKGNCSAPLSNPLIAAQLAWLA
jgi:hypothetical protein